VADEQENTGDLFGNLSVHTEEEPAEVKPSPTSITRNPAQQKRPTTTPAQQKRVQPQPQPQPNLLDDIPAVVPQTSKQTSVAAKQTSRTNQPAQKKETSLEDLLNSPSVKQTDNWTFDNELDPLKNPSKEAEKPIKPTMKQQIPSIYQAISAQQPGYYPYPPMVYGGYPQTYYPGAAPAASSIGIPITSIPMKSTTSYTTSLDAFNFTDNAKATTVTPTTNNNNTATSAKKQNTDTGAFDFVKDAMRTQQNVSGKA